MQVLKQANIDTVSRRKNLLFELCIPGPSVYLGNRNPGPVFWTKALPPQILHVGVM
jgi:hypothetical protein